MRPPRAENFSGRGGSLGAAAIETDCEPDRGTEGRRVTDRAIPHLQIGQHQMYARHCHPPARPGTAWARLSVSARERVRIAGAGYPLTPDGLAFFGVHASPSTWQRAWRDQEVAADLRFQCLPGGPYGIAEGRVFQQKTVALLPHHCRVMPNLPMNDRRDNEGGAFLAKSHLIIHAN